MTKKYTCLTAVLALLLAGCSSSGSAGTPVGTNAGSMQEKEPEEEEILYPIRHYTFEYDYQDDSGYEKYGEGFYSTTKKRCDTFEHTFTGNNLDDRTRVFDERGNLLEERLDHWYKQDYLLEITRYNENHDETEALTKSTGDGYVCAGRWEYNEDGDVIRYEYYYSKDLSLVDEDNITWKEYENMDLQYTNEYEYAVPGKLIHYKKTPSDNPAYTIDAEEYECTYTALDDYGSYEYYDKNGKLEYRKVYDKDGKLLEDGRSVLTYDDRGNVILMESSGGKTEFEFDEENRKIRETVSNQYYFREEKWDYHEDESLTYTKETCHYSEKDGSAYDMAHEITEYSADGNSYFTISESGRNALENATLYAKEGETYKTYKKAVKNDQGEYEQSFGYCKEGSAVIKEDDYLISKTEYERFGMIKCVETLTYTD